MCRMFALSGNYNDVCSSLFKSLSEVSQNDPLYSPDDKITVESHDDGWGFVQFGNGTIIHQRSGKPIFKNLHPPLEGSGKLIVHSRKADKGEPVGTINSHPYHRSDPEYDMYFCHNGAYNKDKISERLGSGRIGNRTDSEMFLDYIVSRPGDPENKLNESIEDSMSYDFVKTTGNFLALAVDKGTNEGRMFYYAFDHVGYEYTDLYRIKGDKWSGVVSSSILHSSFLPTTLNITKVEQGKLFELD